MKYYLVSAEDPEIRKTIQVPDEIIPDKSPDKSPPSKSKKSPNKSKKIKPNKPIKAVQHTKSIIDGSLLDHNEQAGESS